MTMGHGLLHSRGDHGGGLAGRRIYGTRKREEARILFDEKKVHTLVNKVGTWRKLEKVLEDSEREQDMETKGAAECLIRAIKEIDEAEVHTKDGRKSTKDTQQTQEQAQQLQSHMLLEIGSSTCEQ